ncbi:MAG: sigma-70 family RNA polymerase sigma factor [Planctomycetia bacterium]
MKAAATDLPGADGRAAPRPSKRKLAQMWKRYTQTRDEALRNELVTAYFYLVRVISNRIAARLPRSIDVHDLRSVGAMGLMRAVENYDMQRGTPFSSYCASRVRGAILDELRSQDWVPRLVRNRATQYNAAVGALRQELGREPSAHEAAARLSMPVEEAERMRRESNFTSVYTLSPQEEQDDDSRALRRLDVLMDKDSEEPFDRMVARDLAGSLSKVLAHNERVVVALYYKENLTMKEIGSVLGISESRVCQIHTKTLEKLRGHLESLGVRGLSELPETPDPAALRR